MGESIEKETKKNRSTTGWDVLMSWNAGGNDSRGSKQEGNESIGDKCDRQQS